MAFALACKTILHLACLLVIKPQLLCCCGDEKHSAAYLQRCKLQGMTEVLRPTCDSGKQP